MLLLTLVIAQGLAIGRESVYLFAFVFGTTPAIVITYLLIRRREVGTSRERTWILLAAVPAWLAFYVASSGPMIGLAEFFGLRSVFDMVYFPMYLVVRRFSGVNRSISNYAYFWSGYEALIR